MLDESAATSLQQGALSATWLGRYGGVPPRDHVDIAAVWTPCDATRCVGCFRSGLKTAHTDVGSMNPVLVQFGLALD